MRIHVVIPARYASTRLPGKPLAEIAGKPMIRHVWDRAVATGADVIVATDDKRIVDACDGFGARSRMTSGQHASGTDRAAEVAEAEDWGDDEIVVNVQGDEPLMPPALIGQVVRMLQSREDADMATLCAPVWSLEEYLDPNVVKVVLAGDRRALYFSRAPIPWHREGATEGRASQTRYEEALRHLGIYGYRVRALRRLAATPPCLLENIERLEQLRALWLGFLILADVAVETPGPGVDTPGQLEAVRKLLG